MPHILEIPKLLLLVCPWTVKSKADFEWDADFVQ